MLESEVWSKHLKPRLKVYGVATRLENAASASVPDVVFMADGFICFIELKVDHNFMFEMPKYQFAYGVEIAPHIRRQYHWIALWCEDVQGMRMFTFDRARSMEQRAKNDKIHFYWKPVWDKMPSHHHIRDFDSCELWINMIQSISRD